MTVADPELATFVTDAARRVATADDLAALKALEGEVLGRSSPLLARRQALRDLPPDVRRDAGRALNDARQEIERLIEARRGTLEAAARAAALEAERLDLTEIVDPPRRGRLHLVTQALDDLVDVFVGLGFNVAEGPEVETDWYNFEALNFAPDHPARQMQDTLYVKLGEPESTLLRTHTSPVQIRVMQSQPPPVYVVAPGRVYRRDTADASHLPTFNQIEGLVVDRGITFGDLAGTLEAFTRAFFGAAVTTRLRPSFFPFTEPSAEYDISCVICAGEGCRTCSGTGWLELGGCGMVHPNVFQAVGYDPEEWTGFAFGFGTDRLAMMRHGVDDLRELVANDVRFLRQF